MSFESSDDRIERLERMLGEMVSIQKGMLGLIVPQGTINMSIASLIVLLKNDQLHLLKFLMNGPLVADEALRQKFRDMIARMESGCEKIEAQLAQLDQQQKNFLPGLEPPDAMPPIGPAV